MLDHHLQRSIVFSLAFTPDRRFSELKPDEVDNKLFTYHLKKVLQAGYVTKSADGLYALSAAGRRLSTGVHDNEQALIIERAHSVLYLIIRRKSDGAWLFYTRHTYPMLGYSGFMHCNPTVSKTVAQAAADQCAIKTGLHGDFSALGGGYFRVYEGERVESYTHFTLLYCDDIQGELAPGDKQADYFWVNSPDSYSQLLFPATDVLLQAYRQKQPFFIERTFQI